ncbi:unnamed protein product [Strongylus vulgaris]|uniref:Uncharacterized protein n=1 Tax=Strongylus vulgaris TaxID=40348 RepID=A0A3P7J5U2_STRVU|nr:unnamed protein product [Strongylus vulgaris]
MEAVTEISKALQDLINKFDEVNLEVVKNALIDAADDEDDENATIPCEQLSVIESDDEGVKNEVRDHVVIEEGVEKLILTGGDAQADLSIDAGTTNVQVDEKSEPMNKESDINHEWSNEEYKRELEKYKKEHHINSTTDQRNETSCDLYMRCRNQMHLAVDSCAWRFASSKILPTLAESAESLLYKGEEFCDPAEQPLYEELYELVIKRNTRLRTCLDEMNAVFGEEFCDPAEQPLYEELYELVIKRNTRLRTCLDELNAVFVSIFM